VKTLRWAPDAVRDLARLRDFLGSKNAAAAARAAERILQAAATLRERPELGRVVEDEDWREFLVPAGRIAYVLRYRIDEDAVVIARVWHSREDR
jgi:plasmid stabilization system protein ParE